MSTPGEQKVAQLNCAGTPCAHGHVGHWKNMRYKRDGVYAEARDCAECRRLRNTRRRRSNGVRPAIYYTAEAANNQRIPCRHGHVGQWSAVQKVNRFCRTCMRYANAKNKYGMSRDEFEKLHAAANGRCQACHDSSTKKLYIDHCHVTGRVRGLLCNTCNIAAGFLESDKAGAVQRYLRASEQEAGQWLRQ